MNVVNLHGIDAAPWGKPLLANLNLELKAGEIVGIIGPNGAGKTSLFRLLAGDVPPTAGTYRFCGKAMDDWPARDRARVLAVLPQLSLLNFPYKVEEVVMLGRIPHATGAVRDRKILASVMAATDTACLAERTYTQLSGGEKQRVQLARVFAQVWDDSSCEPSLLLLDEPTSALDLAHQQMIMESVRLLAGRGCAAAVISHDFNLLGSCADQLTALSAGRQVATGQPAEVLTEDVFQAVFGTEVVVSRHPHSGVPVVLNA